MMRMNYDEKWPKEVKQSDCIALEELDTHGKQNQPHIYWRRALTANTQAFTCTDFFCLEHG